ncbi:MAG: hypothetical protein HFACDABA_00002 [Anaerolineales bacterium]|nr:hypothetical protein [Anaerolineales bacterium]
MSRARVAIQGIVFIALFLLVMRLPVFPQVAEMRAYSPGGETLSLEYSIGSLKDFIESYRFIRTAWVAAPKIAYAALAAFNALAAFLVCFFGARLSDRVIETWTSSKRVR